MGFLKRITAPLHELEATRLQGRYGGLDVTPIGEMPLRRPVRIRGEVQRIRVVPKAGSPTLEVVVRDGTGDVTVMFTGRNHLGGMTHGRGVEFEGVAHLERGHRVIMNPVYTFLPMPGSH